MKMETNQTNDAMGYKARNLQTCTVATDATVLYEMALWECQYGSHFRPLVYAVIRLRSGRL